MPSRSRMRRERTSWPMPARTAAVTSVMMVVSARSRNRGSKRFISGILTLYHKVTAAASFPNPRTREPRRSPTARVYDRGRPSVTGEKSPMRSKSILAALVAVAVVIGAGFWIRSRRTPPPSTPANAAAPSTPAAPAHARADRLQRRLHLDILHNGLTPDKAKQLFSLMLGDLPGMTMPDEERDPDEFCGTMAVTYIHQVWGALTAAERDAVNKVLGPSPRTARRFGS